MLGDAPRSITRAAQLEKATFVFDAAPIVSRAAGAGLSLAAAPNLSSDGEGAALREDLFASVWPRDDDQPTQPCPTRAAPALTRVRGVEVGVSEVDGGVGGGVGDLPGGAG